MAESYSFPCAAPSARVRVANFASSELCFANENWFGGVGERGRDEILLVCCEFSIVCRYIYYMSRSTVLCDIGFFILWIYNINYNLVSGRIMNLIYGYKLLYMRWFKFIAWWHSSSFVRIITNIINWITVSQIKIIVEYNWLNYIQQNSVANSLWKGE